MNVFAFAGNVCKDIELRSTQNDKKVASFSIAINEGKDKTEFVNMVAWEKTAELLNQYVKKGDRLSGTGRLQTRSWEDQRGEKKYTTEIVINQFDFPPKKSGYQEQPQTGGDFPDNTNGGGFDGADDIPW